VDINPLALLIPIISIIIGVVPVIIVRPNIMIVSASAIAYFVAIGLKIAVEIPLSNLIHPSPLYLQALFYGSLTAIFEVGLAFLIPLAFQNYLKEYTKKKALSYGAMLAFWENAVFVGLIGIIQIGALLALQNYNPALVQQAIHAQPFLAYPTLQLLPLIGFGALERVSSFLAHTAWGSLGYYFLFSRSKKLLFIAFLGYIDGLVPFIDYGIIPLYLAEVIIFIISLVAFIISYKKLS